MSNVVGKDSKFALDTVLTRRRIHNAFLLLTIVTALASVWLRGKYVTTGDTSWLLTLGERFLAGEKLYVDLLEVNPPASIFLYLPPVILARYLPWTAEVITAALIFLSIALAMLLSFSILRRSREGRRILNWPVAAAVVFVLAILPGESFTQREQIATILILPWLALALLRMEGVQPSFWQAILTGVAAGVIFCIKPLFVVPMITVFAMVLWRRPSLKHFFAPEHIIGGAIALAYSLAALTYFPEFWSKMYPLLKAVYLPSRDPAAGWPLTLAWALLVMIIVLVRPKDVWRESSGVLICASAGFVIACLWQAKFWTYHFYPMLALVFIAAPIACMAAVDSEYRESQGRPSLVNIFRCFAPVFLTLIMGAKIWSLYWSQQDLRPLVDAVKRAAPAPAVLNMTYELYTGHPVVRMAGAKWAGSLPSTWICRHTDDLRSRGYSSQDYEKGFAEASRFNLEVFRADFRNKKPNVVIASAVDLEWARRDSELAQHLREFEIVEKLRLEWLALDVFVMGRRKPAME